MNFAEWTGNGSFGEWDTDSFGFPSYIYAPGGRVRPLGTRTTDRGLKHSPWHQVGNSRVTVTAHEDGFLQLYNSDRGLCCVTPYQPLLRTFGAGVAFVRRGDGRPELLTRSHARGAKMDHARFGLGYSEYLFNFGRSSARVAHWVPDNDSPVVVSDVALFPHESDDVKSAGLIFCVGYWFVDMDPLCTGTSREEFFPPPLGSVVSFVSKNVMSPLKLSTDHRRSAFAESFVYKCEAGDDLAIITPERAGAGVFNERRASYRSEFPMSFFCKAADANPVFSVVDSRSVFNADGSIRNLPEARKNSLLNKDVGRPVALVVEFPVRETGVDSRMRMLWGYGKEEGIDGWIKENKDGEMKDGVASRGRRSCRFTIPGLPWVSREWMWHSDYAQSAAMYDGFAGAHTVRQGSAYYFIQGLDGAPRDHALFAVALSYLNPELAREIIRTTARTMHEDGRIPYGYIGYGKSAGFGLHDAPSDLPLFFLWAVSEYVFATRDFKFLDERNAVAGSSKGKTITIKEAAQLAFRFLAEKIGTGEHGLIRVGTGDWNDPLQLHVKNRTKFMKDGESVYNTAMGCYVLPRAADLFSVWDEKSAARAGKFAESLAAALERQWNGRWLNRAWDGNGEALGKDSLYLEHNAWALVADTLSKDKKAELAGNINKRLDGPSRIGASILDPPRKLRFNVIPRGWDTNGGVWHAANMVLTWGYGKVDGELARRSLLKNTLAAHAEAYPDVWFGIWSGPDAYNSFHAERPGETYHHLTPMADYPVMNTNAHANPITAAVKLCGIEPGLKGYRIAPMLPDEEFSLETPLVSVSRSAETLSFGFTPVEPCGELEFTVEDGICGGAVLSVTCGGKVVDYERVSENVIRFTATCEGGGGIHAAVRKLSS